MNFKKLFDLTGKIAIITGASKGLGRSYSLALSSAGCLCILVGRNEQQLAKTQAMIRADNGKSMIYRIDLTDRTAMETMVNQLAAKFRHIDILVNNAGYEHTQPFLAADETTYRAIMDINLKSVFFLSQKVARLMAKAKQGKIINIGSLGSYIGLPESAIYCSSKGAINQLTKTMAVELAKYNIQVNEIVPGYFFTEMTQPFFADKTHKKWIESRIPIGRVGECQDLAGPVIFLSSQASDYMTGQSLIVDGGWLSS